VEPGERSPIHRGLGPGVQQRETPRAGHFFQPQPPVGALERAGGEEPLMQGRAENCGAKQEGEDQDHEWMACTIAFGRRLSLTHIKAFPSFYK
jgi:hypothetical protein